MDCRLFSLRSYANNREIHEVSAVSDERGSKQPRDPRSVGCFGSNAEANSREIREVSVVSARTRKQTIERTAKRRLFQRNANANNREIHEASAVPAGRGRKQPREPRSVGCFVRTRTQTTEKSTKCRLFRPNAEANSRHSS